MVDSDEKHHKARQVVSARKLSLGVGDAPGTQNIIAFFTHLHAHPSTPASPSSSPFFPVNRQPGCLDAVTDVIHQGPTMHADVGTVSAILCCHQRLTGETRRRWWPAKHRCPKNHRGPHLKSIYFPPSVCQEALEAAATLTR